MPRAPHDKRKLERSPLIVVLTEVRFAPILTMGNLIPAIQEELRRNGFPAFSTSHVQQFEFAAGGGEPTIKMTTRWVFASKDSRRTVTITTEGVSLQTTAYDDFEDFLAAAHEAIRVIEAIAEPSFADRIGVRYVDAIANVGDRLSDYFNETVLTFTASDLGVRSLLFSQHIIATTDMGHLQIRLSQVENAPLLPADLNTPELADIGSPKPGVHAILDIDSSDEHRSDFAWDIIEARLWAVHAHASSAFWKSITENARRAWGEQSGVLN